MSSSKTSVSTKIRLDHDQQQVVREKGKAGLLELLGLPADAKVELVEYTATPADGLSAVVTDPLVKITYDIPEKNNG